MEFPSSLNIVVRLDTQDFDLDEFLRTVIRRLEYENHKAIKTMKKMQRPGAYISGHDPVAGLDQQLAEKVRGDGTPLDGCHEEELLSWVVALATMRQYWF